MPRRENNRQTKRLTNWTPTDSKRRTGTSDRGGEITSKNLQAKLAENSTVEKAGKDLYPIVDLYRHMLYNLVQRLVWT